MILLLLAFLPAAFSFVIGSPTYVTYTLASWDLSNGLGPSSTNIPQTVCNYTLILAVLNSLSADVITLQEVDNGTVACPYNLLQMIPQSTTYKYYWYQPIRAYGNFGTTGNLILSKWPPVSTLLNAMVPFRFINGNNPVSTPASCSVPRDGDYCEGAMAIQLQIAPPYNSYGVWIINAILSNNTQVQTDEGAQLYSNFISATTYGFLPQPTIVTGNFQTQSPDAPVLRSFNAVLNNSWTYCGTVAPGIFNYTYPSPVPNYKYQQVYFNGSYISGSTFSTNQYLQYPASISCQANSAYVYANNTNYYAASFHFPVVTTFSLQLPSIWDEFLLFTPGQLATLILLPFFSILWFFCLIGIIYVCACKKKDDAYNEWKHTPIDNLNNQPDSAVGHRNFQPNTRTGGYQTAGGPNRGGFQEVEDPPRDTPRGQYDGGYDEEPSTREPPRRPPPRGGPPPRNDDYDDYDTNRGGRGRGSVPPPPPRDNRNVPPPPPRGGPGRGGQREYPEDDDGRGSRGSNSNRPRAGQLL